MKNVLLLGILIFLCFVGHGLPIETVIYTFDKLNLLSDDLVLKGINPKYDFYIPTLPQMSSANISIKLKFLPELREDSTLTILVDDVPYRTFKAKNVPSDLTVPVVKKRNKNFVKVSLLGNLRISNNICEDIFSDKIYLVVQKNSQIEFTYEKYKNIKEFLIDYDNRYCINSPELIPFVYQFCKQRALPCNVIYGNQVNGECKKIELAKGNTIELKGNTLYVPKGTSPIFEEGVFFPYLFGDRQEIKHSIREPKEVPGEISLRDVGIQTVSIEGTGSLSYSIPFDTSKIGGIPDRLYFKLFIAHTPMHKKDEAELRIYLNGKMIRSYLLEGSGNKSFDVEIPVNEITYGSNNITVNLTNFVSPENCQGAIPHQALTIFENSYFYWNNLKSDPKTISDFFKILNGYVALIIKDKNFYSFATKLANELSIYNKNIKFIDLNPQDLSMYDFVILFVGPEDTKGGIIDLSKGDFELVNPLTKRTIFASKPTEAFAVFMLQGFKEKPGILFSYYSDPSGIVWLNNYKVLDMLELSGNTAVATKDFMSTYEVGRKFRVKYKQERGVVYYWSKYKLWIILIFIVPVTVFLAYVYKKLTGRT